MIMRRKLFLLAVAAAALASCSSDETLSVNQGFEDANAISFRPAIQGTTRAANGTGLKSTWENGDKLYVNAIRTVSSTRSLYFQDEFEKDAVGFNSSAKHFWPADLSTNNLNFTAFWGVPYKTISSYGADDEYLLNTIYTVGTVGAQTDILYAQTAAIDAKPSDGGVMLNFRHMLSQIVIQVANTEKHLDIDVTGVMVGNVFNTGTFKYTGSETSGSGTIPGGSWTSQSTSTSYTQTTSSSPAITTTSLTSDDDGNVAITGYTPLILMPQTKTAASAYSAAEASPASPASITSSTMPAVDGSYIALQMTIKDHANPSINIVNNQWCVWPINANWLPGYKYTYTVNAGSGGYQPIDRNGNTDLDPVLDNAVIWFLPTCSIDSWTDSAIPVDEPIFVSTIAAGGTKTINVARNTVTGHFSITVTGIADADLPANPINVTTVGSIDGTPTAVRVGTKAYITGKINSGTGTSTFTLTDGTTPVPVVTTINIVQ